MNVLTFTRLWPNAVQPHHGVFVEERMRQWAALPGSSLEVIAPVPWFPRVPGPRRWTVHAEVPREETRHDIHARHPRYVVLPGVSPRHQGPSLFAATVKLAERMHERTPFDLVDGHFLWPDGFAACAIARRLGVPVVLSARGSDATTLPEEPGMRAAIEKTIATATMLIAVSRPLAERLVELGADPRRVAWVANGVDASAFRFSEQGRAKVRAALGVDEGETLLLSVGRLEPVKGHDVLLEAVARLRRRVKIAIVGEGSKAGSLAKRAEELGLALTLAGPVPHERLGDWYSAADLFVLPSRNEGHPNALVEALSCGTPSVATAVGAAPDLVAANGGLLARAGDAHALAEAIAKALAREWDRGKVRDCATGRGWETVAREVDAVFREAITRHACSVSASEVAVEAAP